MTSVFKTIPLTIRWRPVAVATGLALLAGCATTPPPPPPPPPPAPPPVAVQEVIPYRPLPPGGAPYAMEIPPRDANGLRLTVNSNLDQVETLWNFRSGWNVAALNCTDAEDARVIDGYSAFLRTFQRQLGAANTELDRRTRRQHNSNSAAIRAREARMTSIYNYFAQPPVRASFCAAARSVAAQMLDSPPSDPNAFAQTNLALFEAAFQQFYTDYERYRVASAEWDQRYGARYGASQPGYVAVWGAAGHSAANLALGDMPVAEVADGATGAAIPVIPVQDGAVATPVVQPVASNASRR